MADRIQLRRDTSARWEEINPILLEGEVGYLLDDTSRYKIGDGATRWNDLPYRGGNVGGGGTTDGDRDNTNGMGYVVLRTNTDLSNQFKYENTIYEVRYNFDLQGKTIEIPNGCILKFVGGKFMNGTMSGFTTIDAETNEIIFDNVTLTSNLYNPIIEADWFGEIGESVDSSVPINKAIQVATTGNIIIINIKK